MFGRLCSGNNVLLCLVANIKMLVMHDQSMIGEFAVEFLFLKI